MIERVLSDDDLQNPSPADDDNAYPRGFQGEHQQQEEEEKSTNYNSSIADSQQQQELEVASGDGGGGNQYEKML
jgi:hypothetical protein